MKRPTLPGGLSLGRAVAELAIIVAGVLIALAAQSWWDGRTEADERADALASLNHDLELIEARMVADSALAADITRAMRLALDEPGEFRARSDSALARDAQLVFWNTVLGNSQYPFPAWDDLQGAGRLNLLPDSVRRGLSELNQLLERFYFSTGDLQAFQLARVDALVIRHFTGRDMLRTGELGIRRGPPPDLGLLGDRETMTVVTMKLVLVVNVQEDLNEAIQGVRTVRGLVQ